MIIFQNVTGNKNETDSRRKFPNAPFWQVICAIQRSHLHSTTSTSGTEAAPGRSSPAIPWPATASRTAPFRRQCGCIADLKHYISCPMIGRCPIFLFGEHLLPLCPDLPVALVEAEKTAVICSSAPQSFRYSSGSLPADSASSTTAWKSSSATRSSPSPNSAPATDGGRRQRTIPCWTSPCPTTWKRTPPRSSGRWEPIWRTGWWRRGWRKGYVFKRGRSDEKWLFLPRYWKLGS